MKQQRLFKYMEELSTRTNEQRDAALVPITDNKLTTTPEHQTNLKDYLSSQMEEMKPKDWIALGSLFVSFGTFIWGVYKYQDKKREKEEKEQKELQAKIDREAKEEAEKIERERREREEREAREAEKLKVIEATKAAKVAVINAQAEADMKVSDRETENKIRLEEARNNMQNPGGELKANSFEYHSASDYLDPNNVIKPMVGFIVPEGNEALLFGMKGSMKSYVTINTFAQLVLGEKPSILSPEEQDAYTAPENVSAIYINGENGKATMKERLEYYKTSLDGRFEVLDVKRFGLTLKDLFTVIHVICITKPAGTRIVIGVDNVKSVLNDLSKEQVKEYLNCWKDLRDELASMEITLTTITVCHTEKTGEKIFGSYDLECLTPYALRVDASDEDHTILTLTNARDGDIRGQKRNLRIECDGYKHHVFEAFINETKTSSKPDKKVPTKEELNLQEAQKIQDYLSQGHKKEEAAKYFKMSRPTLNERLKLLKPKEE